MKIGFVPKKTPDRLVHYHSNHVSVGPSPTLAAAIILQNVRSFESKEPAMVMKTKDNHNKPHHS